MTSRDWWSPSVPLGRRVFVWRADEAEIVKSEIQVFKTPPNMPDEEYIKVRVLPGPDERSPMGNWEHMTRPSAGHLRVKVIENGPKPLREAWESAKEYAASAAVTVIYLEDSHGQFGLQI